MDFKERIFQARKTKGFSQEDWAELVGVSRQAVSKWETGDAMPDTEKLIALCQALELDMEYLTLGKPVAPAVSWFKKPLFWVCASALSVAFFGMGFFVGYRVSPPVLSETAGPSGQSSTIGSQQQIVVNKQISDVKIQSVPGRKLELSVLPAVVAGEQTMQLLCQDKIANKTTIHQCAFDGTYYRLQLSKPDNYHYYITAILETEGVKEQFPLAEITGDEYSWSMIHLWEN